MRDFTVAIYKKLLAGLIQSGYRFMTFSEFVRAPQDTEKTVILRHDIDRLPANALKTAQLETDFGIIGTYYFRQHHGVFNDTIIRGIANMGHEIGYHYESLATAKGNVEKGIKDFEINLSRMREIAPVKTICMHGRPLSKWDSRNLWTHYNYRDFGIIGEPYIDIDFSQVLYLSDTGRKWINDHSNVRDKVDSGFEIKIRNTSHLISLISNAQLPNKLMINIHPQRWTDKPMPWLKELFWQNMKNGVKYFIVKGSNK